MVALARMSICWPNNVVVWRNVSCGACVYVSRLTRVRRSEGWTSITGAGNWICRHCSSTRSGSCGWLLVGERRVQSETRRSPTWILPDRGKYWSSTVARDSGEITAGSGQNTALSHSASNTLATLASAQGSIGADDDCDVVRFEPEIWSVEPEEARLYLCMEIWSPSSCGENIPAVSSEDDIKTIKSRKTIIFLRSDSRVPRFATFHRRIE